MNTNDDSGVVLRRQKELDLLRRLKDRQPETEEDFPFQGVLLSDAIAECVTNFGLITPFEEENLKAASYKLRIGDQYALNGAICPLKDVVNENKIKIPPFAVAVVKTHEIINMPRFLIARWNIQVSRAYEGLVWVGGPQVDPGYIGHLFCPIYNLGDKEVELKMGDPIAVIDFVRTTPYQEGKSKKYKFPPDNILFEDYKPETLVSGLVTKAKTRIDEFEVQLQTSTRETKDELKNVSQETRTKLEEIVKRIDAFVSITFSVIAVLFAAVTIFVARSEQPSLWNPVLFLISGTAIYISVSTWVKTRHDFGILRRITQLCVIAFMILATFLQLRTVSPINQQIEKLKRQVDQLEQQTKAPTPIVCPSPPPALPATVSTEKPVVKDPAKKSQTLEPAKR